MFASLPPKTFPVGMSLKLSLRESYAGIGLYHCGVNAKANSRGAIGVPCSVFRREGKIFSHILPIVFDDQRGCSLVAAYQVPGQFGCQV